MGYKEPTFYDIVWSVALRNILDYNDSYNELITKRIFIGKLRNNPENLSQNEIKNLLKFLNKWGCRINKNDFELVSSKLKEFIVKYKGKFYIDKNIQTFNFNANKEQLMDLLENLNKVDEIGTTATSKILHIINPELFVMWDANIAEKLNFKHSVESYFKFLNKMKISALNIQKTFEKSCYFGYLNITDVVDFINKYFKLNPEYTLTKFLDEYNWAKYSQGWKFPPEKWNPEILFRARIFRSYPSHAL